MELLFVAISVIVSLAADIALDCYILKNYKISSKSKNSTNKQDILKEIRNKISKLEQQIDSLSKNDRSDANGVSELKKEVEILKHHLKDENNTAKNNEDLIHVLREMAGRIAKLEEDACNHYPVRPLDTGDLENKIIQLNQEIASLKQLMNVPNQFAEHNSQLEQMVFQLNNEVEQLKNVIAAQQQIIQEQENKKHFTETKTISQPTPQPSTKPVYQPSAKSVYQPSAKSVSKLPFTVSAKVIIPNRNYVETLLSNLLSIQNHLGSIEYEHCKKKLQNILDNGDFEDYEEIMSAVHEMIQKYVYGSNTKVAAEDWKQIEKYIENAGYVAVPVKAGDDIKPYRTYFERPIAASGGMADTIKQIQLKPFVLFYEDGGEKEMVKLCGKCTYYK